MNKQANSSFYLALLASGALVSICLILGFGLFNTTLTQPISVVPNFTPSVTPSRPAYPPGINYGSADVDRGEALWNSKHINSYQIEVWSGGITPPPPVYVIQVWQDKVVYASKHDSPYSGRTPESISLGTDAPQVQELTVAGLFSKVRRLIKEARYSTPSTYGHTIQVRFDEQWGFPSGINESSNCPDCVSFSTVQKFIPFDSANPPPTPTPLR